ncbi:hypothetical protein SLS62_007557 [Diatrype stigma]|uniref:Uncharacterized protein n=1 Tax=Diatrype stigma TaxID=117547 RepID=A0AAN9UMY8_9PEZI
MGQGRIPQRRLLIALPNASNSRCGRDPREYLAPFSPDLLRPGAPVLRTLDQVRALSRRHKGDMRLEEVEGAVVLIQLSTSTHIGTVEGEALELVRRRLEQHRSSDSTGVTEDVVVSLEGRKQLTESRVGGGVGRTMSNCIAVRDCPKECLLLF